LFYPHPKKNPGIYLGVGPFVSYQINTNDTDYKTYYADTLYSSDNSTRDSDEFSVGITGLIGVEIFINDFFSLHAEYVSSVYYRYRMYKTNSHQMPRTIKRIQKSDGFYFSGNSVLFGLSVYF
jgi:hypothetical protein